MGDNLPAVDLGTGKTASAIATGNEHACALLNDGSVKCWGHNDSGQLGLGDTSYRGDGPNEMGDNLPAVDLGTGKTASAIVAGGYHTCALLNDGTVKCWGFNIYGQLGLGDTSYRGDGPNEMWDNLPAINLGTGTTASAIVAGLYHTCALLNDDSVKCWGYNGHGQLGLGDNMYRGDQPNEMGDNLPAVKLFSAFW
jgi:alpha-tubulin suppressor-like RCC1 family protein